MRSERGQSTVEWTGLLLLVALVLVAAGHVAARGDGRELGTTLAAAVTRAGHPSNTALAGPAPKQPPLALSGRPPASPRKPASALPGPRSQALAPSARSDPLGAIRRAAPDALRRAGRGAGTLWRRAWFACLVWERTRYAFRHPESRLPGYTLPYGVALRMINSCVSPVDLLRDVPGLDPGP